MSKQLQLIPILILKKKTSTTQESFRLIIYYNNVRNKKLRIVISIFPNVEFSFAILNSSPQQ